MADPTHPLMLAIHPLVSRIGATVVDPKDLRADDIPLEWGGSIVAGIRLNPGNSGALGASLGSANGAPNGAPGGAGIDPEPAAGLDVILADLEAQFGAPLAALDRAGKQRPVRMLEEGGAFSYRKSVEAVAAALGISRFTVYNYLNRDRE
ncbi:MAG: helix-turn-helix domain-containing protein [Nakamurella sp.]